MDCMHSMKEKSHHWLKVVWNQTPNINSSLEGFSMNLHIDLQFSTKYRLHQDNDIRVKNCVLRLLSSYAFITLQGRSLTSTGSVQHRSTISIYSCITKHHFKDTWKRDWKFIKLSSLAQVQRLASDMARRWRCVFFPQRLSAGMFRLKWSSLAIPLSHTLSHRQSKNKKNNNAIAHSLVID